MKKIVLHGRKVVGGCAEGEALVTKDTISGWGGVNPMEGIIVERRHKLRGQSFKGKVLVFPGAKGLVGVGEHISCGTVGWRRAHSHGFQRNDHKNSPRRGGNSLPCCYGS